jgi:hypothetical protein
MHISKLVLKLAVAVAAAFVVTSAHAASSSDQTGTSCNARNAGNIWDQTVEKDKPKAQAQAKKALTDKETREVYGRH